MTILLDIEKNHKLRTRKGTLTDARIAMLGRILKKRGLNPSVVSQV